MNKYLKLILKIVSAIALFIVCIIALFFLLIENNRKNLENKARKKSKTCDTISVISEQPIINLIGFKINEIDTLSFTIIRNKKRIQDTIVIKDNFTYASEDSTYFSVEIPFKNFLKTDSLLLTTKNRLYYYISDFRHSVGLRYGMTGPVAVSECELSDYILVNNSISRGSIKKIAGWLHPNPSSFKRIISVQTKLYDSLATTFKIDETKATTICKKNIKNRGYTYITSIIGMEQNNEDYFYIFKEPINDQHDFEYIKINAKTGAYNRYKEYPSKE